MAVIKYRTDDLSANFKTFATKVTGIIPFTNSNSFTVEDASQIQVNQRVSHPQAQPQTFVSSVDKTNKLVTLTKNISIDAGQEDIVFESDYTTNSVLSTNEIDSNFKSLNDRKIEADGSIPVEGDLTIAGSIVANNIDASSINISGGFLSEDTTDQTDDPGSLDSLVGVNGQFQEYDTTPGATNRRSNKIFVTEDTVRSNFTDNTIIRIYGAGSTENNQINSPPSPPSLERVGFAETGSTKVTFQYRFSVFNLSSGEFSASSNSSSIDVALPPELESQFSNVFNAFNIDRFIRITNLSTIAGNGQGVLIYRKGPNDSNYRLAEVLGEKEVAQGIWIDYYNFDYNTWSGKRSSDNTFDESTLIHFPINSPSSSGRGWVDRQITSIEDNPLGGFTLTLKDNVIINDGSSTPTCQIAHNDTPLIQGAINANRSVGFVIGRNFLVLSFKSKKALVLNSKRFVCSQLELPNDFSLSGSPGITEVRKLPWSGVELSSSSQNLIRAKESRPQNVIVNGIRFNGDLNNQFLFNEGITLQNINYAINLRDQSESCRISNCEIENVIGGGIHATNPQDFEIFNSGIRNSGRSDRFVYSPLIASNGRNLFVQGSKFRNFTEFADVSVTNRGVFVNNIIENCGSGVLVYGSKFFIANPNVLIGPAGEFLPNADSLNSEYDAANIVINDVNSDFTSPVFRYQENGDNYDLTQTSVGDGISEIIYQAQLIEKDSITGQEVVWNANPAISIVDVPNAERNQGVFQFRIPQESVQKIKIASGDFSAKTLSSQNPDHVGVVWNASYRYELPSGDITTETPSEWNGEFFTATIENLTNISVGSSVTIRNSTGWSSGGVVEGTVTKIVDVAGSPTLKSVEVRFVGATNTSPGSGGQINIIDRFIMAQGRIL